MKEGSSRSPADSVPRKSGHLQARDVSLRVGARQQGGERSGQGDPPTRPRFTQGQRRCWAAPSLASFGARIHDQSGDLCSGRPLEPSGGHLVLVREPAENTHAAALVTGTPMKVRAATPARTFTRIDQMRNEKCSHPASKLPYYSHL